MKCTYLDSLLYWTSRHFIYSSSSSSLPPRLPRINRISGDQKGEGFYCVSVGDGQIAGGREKKSSNNLVLVVYYQQSRQGEMESILVVSGGELEKMKWIFNIWLTEWTARVTNLVGSAVEGGRVRSMAKGVEQNTLFFSFYFVASHS